jgi:hypothetical protein
MPVPRTIQALLAPLLLALLAACGPGLGGTGTGDAAPPGNGASLSASFWVDDATGGQRRLLLVGNGATWRDDCARLLFEGEGTAMRYTGSTLVDGAPLRLEAGLVLKQPQPGGPLLLQLYDAAGQPQGPVQALRPAGAGYPAPAACPGA